MWRFPKIRGTYLGVPRRTIVYWGLYVGTLTLGNYHVPSYWKPFVALALHRLTFHENT